MGLGSRTFSEKDILKGKVEELVLNELGSTALKFPVNPLPAVQDSSLNFYRVATDDKPITIGCDTDTLKKAIVSRTGTHLKKYVFIPTN